MIKLFTSFSKCCRKAYRKLIFRTPTKPQFLEVYFHFTDRFDDKMGLYFIFRVCRANKKNSNVTIVAEYPLYIRNVHIFLDISTGIRNATLPDIFYLYKRLRVLYRIGGIQSDEYRTSDEARSQEGIYREFLERTKENNDRGAFMCEIYYEKPSNPTDDCKKRKASRWIIVRLSSGFPLSKFAIWQIGFMNLLCAGMENR